MRKRKVFVFGMYVNIIAMMILELVNRVVNSRIGVFIVTFYNLKCVLFVLL